MSYSANDLLSLNVQGLDISLKRPWRRASMHDLVKEATGVDFYALNDDLEAARYHTMAFESNVDQTSG